MSSPTSPPLLPRLPTSRPPQLQRLYPHFYKPAYQKANCAWERGDESLPDARDGGSYQWGGTSYTCPFATHFSPTSFIFLPHQEDPPAEVSVIDKPVAPPVEQPSAAASYSWPSPESTESDKLLDVSVFSQSSKSCLPCYSCRSHVTSLCCFCSGVKVQAGSASASEMRASRLARAGLNTPTPTTIAPVCPATFDSHSGRTSPLALFSFCFHRYLPRCFFFFLLQVAFGGRAHFSPDLGSLYLYSSCHSQATTQMYLSPPRLQYGSIRSSSTYDSE
jgi:hypothetical protein